MIREYYLDMKKETEARRPKILIIEDNDANHSLFRQSFENFGFEVVISDTAEDDFVEAVYALKPDVISMDIMIGKANIEVARDGLQALELLKSDDRTKDIPVIMLTNFHTEDKVEKAKSLGAVDYINLQSRVITQVPEIYLNYLANPEVYIPVHPAFQARVK